MRLLLRLLNLVFFQFAQITGRKRFFAFVHGRLLAFPLNRGSEEMNRAIVKGVYENDEILILQKVMLQSDKVLELGGAVGALAVVYGKLSQHPHFLIEANRDLVSILHRNLSSNHLEHVAVLNAIAGTRDSQSERFHIHKNFYSSSIVDPGNGNFIESPMVDINRVLKETGASFLIMDVEGAEYELIEKMRLESLRALMVEFHEKGRFKEQFLPTYRRIVESGLEHSLKYSRGNVFVFQRPVK